jgi:methyl-accepting chemotaxis protein
MKNMSRWGNIGLKMKLIIVIQGILLTILIAAHQWIISRIEHDTLKSAEDKARMVADGLINGLNTLMVTKVANVDVISNHASRSMFIKKMGESENIKEARIVRAKQLDEEFPAGMPEEQPIDEIDQRVLASGKPEFLHIKSADGGAGIRAVMPFIASKNYRGTNCLKCHGVDEGFTLGLANVTVDVEQELQALKRINIMIWIGQVILQIILFFVLSRLVSGLLRQFGGEPAYVIDIVKQISTGNLSEEIITKNGDNTSLLAAIKHMQSGLKDIIGGVLQTANLVAQEALALSASSRQGLNAAENQSDAISSAAAAVEEMTVCIGHISDNAVDTHKNSSAAGTWAKEGADVVKGVIVEMDKISAAVATSTNSITALGEKSNQISSIAKVIKEIAEQTNLLALNAAIEAARAGEQGRGFAVVADEVRKLAERTYLATQEIVSMIKTIQESTTETVAEISKESAHVNEGVQMVNLAGNAMDKIQDGVQKVLSSVEDISSSLREQRISSDQLAKNIEGVVHTTEETSHIIREVAVSANNLEQQALSLKESVGKFRL